jgi:hypothetical protein
MEVEVEVELSAASSERRSIGTAIASPIPRPSLIILLSLQPISLHNDCSNVSTMVSTLYRARRSLKEGGGAGTARKVVEAREKRGMEGDITEEVVFVCMAILSVLSIKVLLLVVL